MGIFLYHLLDMLVGFGFGFVLGGLDKVRPERHL